MNEADNGDSLKRAASCPRNQHANDSASVKTEKELVDRFAALPLSSEKRSTMWFPPEEPPALPGDLLAFNMASSRVASSL